MPSIRNPNAPPTEGWHYPGIDGFRIKADAWSQLYGKVLRHYRANGQEPPTAEAVERWVCENLPVRCREGKEVFRNKHSDPPTYLSRGLPSPHWPLALRPFKLLAREGDRGLGDIVLRVIGNANSQAFKSWYRGMFGKECGCTKRQIGLNQSYPL